MPGYGIIGEDKSDAETLKVLVRRVSRAQPQIKTKGFGGCGEMLTKGAAHLRLFSRQGLTRFVICYDADNDDPAQRKQVAVDKIVRPSGVAADCCVIVPVQEIEAWILADLPAVAHVITGWRPDLFAPDPETVNDPKEHLERLSRASNYKPRYAHRIHNPRIAEYLDLGIVVRRCPSYRPLAAWIAQCEAGDRN